MAAVGTRALRAGALRARAIRWVGALALLAASVAEPGEPFPAGRFQHLSVSDGLSEARLRGITQDREGFLWICTAAALDRYDGFGFRMFRHDPADPASIGPGIPRAVLQDRQGLLWVGLINGGLSRYDPSTERFTRFLHDPADVNSLSHDYVDSLLEDRQGTLWVATGGGLNRFDATTGRFARFRHDPGDPASLGGDEVTSLAEDRSGALWVGTTRGLNRTMPGVSGSPPRFERWRHEPRNSSSISSDSVSTLLVDREGRLWVGTWDAGLNRYDPERGTFVRYGSVAGEPGSLGGSRIYGLLEDHTGRLWIATWGGGVSSLLPSTGEIRRYTPDLADPQSLSHANVTALFEDRSGLLWMGTGGGGLDVLDLKAKGFRSYPVTGTKPGGLSARDVRAVLLDRRGDLWVGTAGGGLNRLDRSRRVVERFRHRPADPHSLADDTVWALLEDAGGTLWIATFAGLDRFDPATRRFRHHRHDPANPESLNSDTVYSLHEDGAGRLWVGTWSGVSILDRKRGRFRRYPVAGGAVMDGGVDPIFAISHDAQGAIWLATSRSLARLDPATGARQTVAPERSAGRPAGDGVAWVVKQDPAGRLWSGTREGLVEILSTADGEPRLRHHAVALNGAAVASIEWDRDRMLWLGTTKGLVRHDLVRGHTRVYDLLDGLPGMAFNFTSFQTSAGELFFGTTDGVTSFLPAEIQDEETVPPVVLTGLQLGHRQVPVGSSLLPRRLSETPEVRLAHDERIVTFEFAALGFRAPRDNRYRYRLEGFEASWNDVPPGRREVTYTNLRPQRYVFRVIAANSDGVWNKAGASLVVHVLSPWWGTWWFRVLAFLAVTSLLASAHRVRTRTIRARSQRLEREVSDRRCAQEALARSEQQLRLIADSLPVLIAYVDAQRRCVFANVAADRLLNRPRSELEGRPLDEILPPEVLVKIAAPMARALAGQGGTFELEVGDGAGQGLRRISTTLVPHTTSDGGTQGFYALAQDITDRVRSEEAVRRQQEQLAHASRVLTLGELAAALAHELNQPLTAILSNAQATLMLQEQDRIRNGDVREALQDIAHDAARAGDIIRKLRDLARRGESHRDRMDLNQAIVGLRPLLHAGALENEVALEMELSPTLPAAQGDVIQMQQVILNLARNGMEAMRTVPRNARRLRILSRHEGGSAVVEVRDTGSAVSDETFQGLFVPFYTTKAGGLGMGLAITRSIVEAHGGRIVAERNPGDGLTLRFTIPLLRSENARRGA